MTDPKVADLSQVRIKKSPARHWTIPPVFRITGFEYDEISGESAKRLVPSRRPIMPRYTLFNEEGDFDDIANPEITKVTSLDPNIDQGWVIVRLHGSFEEAHGYAQREVDGFMANPGSACGYVFCTSAGNFTLTHFPFVQKALQPLIVYIRLLPGKDIADFIGSDTSSNQYTIRHPDDSVTHDPSVLFLDG